MKDGAVTARSPEAIPELSTLSPQPPGAPAPPRHRGGRQRESRSLPGTRQERGAEPRSPRDGPRRRGTARRGPASSTGPPPGRGGRRPASPPPARRGLRLPACNGRRRRGRRAPSFALPAGRHVPLGSANRGGAGRVTCLCLALLCAAGRAGAEWDRSSGAGRWVRGVGISRG